MKPRVLGVALGMAGLAAVGYFGGRALVGAAVPSSPVSPTMSIIDPRNAIVFTPSGDETRLNALLDLEATGTTWLLLVRQGCWSCSAEVRAYASAFEQRIMRGAERFLTILVVDTLANWDRSRVKEELAGSWPLVESQVFLADPFMAREWLVTVYPTLLRWTPERSLVAVEVARGPGFVDEFARYNTDVRLFPSGRVMQ